MNKKKTSLILLLLNFFLQSAPWGFDDFFDEVSSIRNDINKYFYPVQTQELKNDFDISDRKAFLETKSKPYGVKVQEENNIFSMILDMNTENIQESNISSYRNKNNIEIKINAENSVNMIYLTENQYYIKLQFREVVKNNEKNNKFFSSSEQQIVRQGAMDKPINTETVEIEVLNGCIRVTALSKEPGSKNTEVPVKFSYKKENVDSENDNK